VARRNIDAEGEIVAITEERFEHGLGSELAVAQARTQLANLEAIVPLLDADAAQARHALAVLTGRNPGELDAELAEGSATLPHVPVLPPTMPSEVVANRPDIRAAERQFAASNARIGASIAAEYPSFTIAPELDFQTQTLGHLLTGNAFGWALSSNVGETIFDGGRLAAGVDQAKAQAEADRLNYRKTILGAFREVEDSLAALSGEQRRRGALAEALADSSLALKRAQEAYRGGFGSFLDVLDSERSVYTAEDAVAQGDQALAEDTVTLYRALGGGWQGVKAE
jgi:NodT family efflux transporter outer membrane factor (OMF) lipoprotein